MSGSRRVAILAAVVGAAGATVACEALVGITDRQVAPPDGGTDGQTSGSSSGGGTETGAEGAADSTAPESGVGDDGQTGSGQDAEAGMDAVADGDAGVGVGVDTGTGADSGPGADADAGSDARPSLDASDAGDGSDGAVMDPDLPCGMQAPGYRFCDDFDTSSTPGQKWDTANTLADGGVIQFDTAHFVSSPQSVQVVAPAVTTGTGGVQLIKTIYGLAAGVRLAFDFRIDSASYTSFPMTCVGQIYVRQGAAAQSQINLVVGPGNTSQLQASVPDAGGQRITASAPAIGTWVRAVISYQSDGTLSLLENGQLIGSVNIGAGPAATVLLISATPFIVASTGTETVTVEEDNILVTAQ
jgi:hypothetical protein